MTNPAEGAPPDVPGPDDLAPNGQDPSTTPAGDDAPTDIDSWHRSVLRVSDTDRQGAVAALGEHLTAGRITLDEYGERNAHIMVAKTFGEILTQFEDLPAPHPTLSGPAPVVPGSEATHQPALPPSWRAPAQRGGSGLHAPDRRSTPQRIVAVAASLSVFAALALFFTTGSWLWFLLIPAISGAARAIWGQHWRP